MDFFAWEGDSDLTQCDLFLQESWVTLWVIHHGNGKSKINRGFNRNITYGLVTGGYYQGLYKLREMSKLSELSHLLSSFRTSQRQRELRCTAGSAKHRFCWSWPGCPFPPSTRSHPRASVARRDVDRTSTEHRQNIDRRYSKILSILSYCRCLYTHVYIYIYIYTHMFICTRIYIYIYILTYTYTCLYTYMCKDECVFICFWLGFFKRRHCFVSRNHHGYSLRAGQDPTTPGLITPWFRISGETSNCEANVDAVEGVDISRMQFRSETIHRFEKSSQKSIAVLDSATRELGEPVLKVREIGGTCLDSSSRRGSSGWVGSVLQIFYFCIYPFVKYGAFCIHWSKRWSKLKHTSHLYQTLSGRLGVSEHRVKVHLHLLHSKDQGQPHRFQRLCIHPFAPGFQPRGSTTDQRSQDNYCNRLKVKREFAGVQNAGPKAGGVFWWQKWQPWVGDRQLFCVYWTLNSVTTWLK